VFDSQDRKIQETDPKDVIWDEIVGKEEHPEDGDGYKFLETDSEAFIRDENCGKEEYPRNCSVIYSSPPCFDEYGDEEWYSRFTGGVVVAPVCKAMADDGHCGSTETVVNGKYLVREMIKDAKVPGIIFDEFLEAHTVVMGGLATTCGIPCATTNVSSKGAKMWNKKPPSPELDETTSEVEQFRRVLIIVQKIWVDIPFDPGGFGPKRKLEDEFFPKRGRMMQATRTDPVIWNLTRDPTRPARRPAQIILYDLIF
jgi:hypothetical protein